MHQVRALIWLRWRLGLNRLRSLAGWANLASAGLIGLLVAGAGLGLAVLLGFATYYATQRDDLQHLRVILFFAFCFFAFVAIILPVFRGFMTQGIDVSRFSIFPLSRRRLYAVTLGSHAFTSEQFFYYPGLIVLCLTGALPRGLGALAGSTIVGLLAVSYVIWSHAAVLALQIVVRSRRFKEILSIGALVLVLLATLIPLVLHSDDKEPQGQTLPEKIVALIRGESEAGEPGLFLTAAKTLPPGLAASGLVGLHRGQGALPWWAALVGLLLWNGAGLGLGYFVFSTHHFGVRERARKKARAARRAGAAVRERRPLTIKAGPIALLPDAILAVAGKELRYLGRSALGKYGIIALPLVVVIILMAMGEGGSQPFMGLAPESLLLYGILLYAVLLSNNPVHNAFAWERGGVQSYFLSPTPLHRVIAGKNLAVLAVNALVFILCMAIWTFFVRLPDARTWVMSVLFFADALGIFILVGNVVSILFPRAMDVSSLASSPSQAGTLFAFLSVFAAGGVLLITMAVPALLGLASLQPVGLAVVLIAVVAGYFVVLKLAARLLEERREAVIEAVTSKD